MRTGFVEWMQAVGMQNEKTWVAFGPAGAVGSIHRREDGYAMKLLDDPADRGVYPSLEVAKSALYAALLPGSDWPEFREH